MLDRLFALAGERGLDLDLHVDESLDPGGAFAAPHRRGGAAPPLRRQDPLRSLLLARRAGAGRGRCGRWISSPEAGIAVVSLPMCNLYLQDRVPGRTPRRRGVTLLHEMAARGIPVALASDNCRDPFFA